MKVLMLGWEYPPHISGGLGTACEGLTAALARRGIEIDFVIPRLYGGEDAPHMKLFGASGLPPAPVAKRRVLGARTSSASTPTDESEVAIDSTAPEPSLKEIHIPAMLAPYLDDTAYQELWAMIETEAQQGKPMISAETIVAPLFRDSVSHTLPFDLPLELPPATSSSKGAHYGHDLFAEVARYALVAAAQVQGNHYDLVHVHDWMTFPAGIEICRRNGRPLIVHVHSLEFDRSGDGSDPKIVAVERQGLDAATAIVAVSYYTRDLIHRIHGTPLEKISVVHNGVYAREVVRAYAKQQRSAGPTVLFLGRVTFQKGPEYFVHAAAKVLKHVPDATFVMAGSGDMLPRMKALVLKLGIEESFRFPGFVRGEELEETFSTAAVYVMPSVSEPFGIAPLEAMSYDRPVIVSKQSGVSEVLRNALKVDFWDTDRMASQIVAVLELPELRKVLVERARHEIRQIHWDAAAEKLLPVYEAVRGS